MKPREGIHAGYSGLATPKTLAPRSVSPGGGGSPVGLGGVAGMKPCEGEHASTLGGCSGGGFPPPMGALFPSGPSRDLCLSPLRYATARRPRVAGASVHLPRSPRFAATFFFVTCGPRRCPRTTWLLCPGHGQAPGLCSRCAVQRCSCWSWSPSSLARFDFWVGFFSGRQVPH